MGATPPQNNLSSPDLESSVSISDRLQESWIVCDNLRTKQLIKPFAQRRQQRETPSPTAATSRHSAGSGVTVKVARRIMPPSGVSGTLMKGRVCGVRSEEHTSELQSLRHLV